MKDLQDFENSNPAESEKSDITVLEGRGTKEEIKLKERARNAERLIQ